MSTAANAVTGMVNRGRARPSADTPAPRNRASPSVTSGTARGVLRSDSPASVPVKALNRAPTAEGLSHGWAAMAVSAPTTTTVRNRAR